MAIVKHQKIEGLLALIINVLVMLDSGLLPSLSLVLPVLNTAKTDAEYDSAGKVTKFMDDGVTPVVAGTIASLMTKALLVLARLLELLQSVLATCAAHMVVKQSFDLKFCPIIVLLPAAFLGATALAALKQGALFSWAEAFAGLFCFSGPVALPWSVPFVNCKASTYYVIRFFYLMVCGVIIGLAVKRRTPDAFMLEVLRITILAVAGVALLLAAIWVSLAAPSMPPKVLPPFMQAVAGEEKSFPEAWQPFKELLKRGYGFFNAEEEKWEPPPGRG